MNLPRYTPQAALALVQEHGDGNFTDADAYTYRFCSTSSGLDTTAAEVWYQGDVLFVPSGEPGTPLEADAVWVQI